ncbi:hypothetical protein LTR56_014468 [Elasticomyces elasticus]|nr:hypothetical protein LTR56_014468 [Elasticomyces elasticus]KAK3646526.1 hypothetical protein LTR22_014289 [Elasticomyces elasticus]KAK4910447.1 hypothetical protein LTR49_020882 [Elasticomyces elasticus]KAK5755663.1 hypothetical protein LTS12_014224 [Elasticomyces elasticus]
MSTTYHEEQELELPSEYANLSQYILLNKVVACDSLKPGPNPLFPELGPLKTDPSSKHTPSPSLSDAPAKFLEAQVRVAKRGVSIYSDLAQTSVSVPDPQAIQQASPPPTSAMSTHSDSDIPEEELADYDDPANVLEPADVVETTEGREQEDPGREALIIECLDLGKQLMAVSAKHEETEEQIKSLDQRLSRAKTLGNKLYEGRGLSDAQVKSKEWLVGEKDWLIGLSGNLKALAGGEDNGDAAEGVEDGDAAEGVEDGDAAEGVEDGAAWEGDIKPEDEE